MPTEKVMTRFRSLPSNWPVLAGAAAALLVYALLFFFALPLRPLAIAAHFHFVDTALAIFFAFPVIFNLRGWAGELLGLPAVVALFGLSLLGLWAAGQTFPSIVAGLLPWSDASNYYMDAQRLLLGGAFSQFSSWRPLFPGLLSLLLWLTGLNLQAALALLALITGTAAYLFAREVQRSHGPWAAVIVLLLIFFYYRYRVNGTTLSEQLGIGLGLLGFALLWRAAGERRSSWTYIGIFVVSLALNARPGTFFVLPALMLWAGRMLRGERRFSWTAFGLAALAALAGFAVNMLVLRLVAAEPALPFSNFSYAVYGLATGGRGFSALAQDHPEVHALRGQERFIRAYALAVQEILRNPLGIVRGSLQYWGLFFSNTYYSVFSYVGGENALITLAARLGLYGLSLLGLFAGVRARRDPRHQLILAAGTGLLLSVPFVPPKDAYGLRLYAATIPLITLFPAVGLSLLAGPLEKRLPWLGYRPRQASRTVVVLAPALAAITLIAPVIAMLAARPALAPAVSCPAGSEAVYVRYAQGSSINVLPEKEFFLDGVPNLHYGRYQLSVHGLPDQYFITQFEQIEPPAKIFLTVDLKTQAQTWVIGDPQLFAAGEGDYGLCAVLDDDPRAAQYGFRYIQSAVVLPR